MDKENQLLQQLINYQNDKNNENIEENAFYDDLNVEQVAKTVTDLIYDRKYSIIPLIAKWTFGPHLINETNVKIYLNTIFDVSHQIETIKHPAINIKSTIKRKYETNLETRIKCGLIEIFNKKLYEEVNIPLKTLQNNSAEALIEYFNQFDEIYDICDVISSDETIEIDFVLGVIKLNNPEITLKLIEYLICKRQHGIIKEIWNLRGKLRLCQSSVNVILQKCTFIIETVVLKHFTLVLNNQTTNIDPEIVKYIPQSLFDSILVLSNYDKRILFEINRMNE